MQSSTKVTDTVPVASPELDAGTPADVQPGGADRARPSREGGRR
ncbi:hypothetical protein SEA_MUFASA8_88 [Arthrobacter phage Mufasa8]|uniref:Uncharacterized protein n=1 Tax=Arthrobacter phage Mufasa8 TaxID=2656526 RepID=A0A649VPG6_9CAUD|nr:hypothetical protein HYQ08_gp088 [Arthrobacter phage Mufasa8]QGJ93553.1 hypothetical protein SEA_MUFASA8_88 [Arthrobacter phage Mufasa8]